MFASICGSASVMFVKDKLTSPETTAAVAGAPPLKGTWVILVPLRASKSATEKYINPPAPLEP